MAGERASRYDTIIATFVGALALLVSAYTAWIQRQQVRAQVWPIVQCGSSNEPALRVSCANKGVGPALIKHVIVTVDEEAVTTWKELLQRLLGPGKHNYWQSTIGGRTLSAGEDIDMLQPRSSDGTPMTIGKPDSDGARFDRERARIGVEICYCSTLGDCWTLIDRPSAPPVTVETRCCPKPSTRTFTQ